MKKSNKFSPWVREDALVLHAADELDDDLFQRTSYLPMLAVVAAVLAHEESLSTLRDTVVPRVSAATTPVPA